VRNVWDRAFPPAATVEPPGSPLPTIYSSLIHQSSFHVTGNRCYNRVISSPPPSPLETLQLDHTMQEWLATLPSWLSPESTGAEGVPWLEFSVQKLFWRYCNLRIIIGRRAFLEQAVTGRSLSHGNLGDGNDSVDAQNSANCLQSALDTIRAIHKFCWNSHSNRLELWYAL
jgi:transcriptional regulatory protein GAL4